MIPHVFEAETPSLQRSRWRWQHRPVLGLFGALDTSTSAPVAIANMRRMLTELATWTSR